MRLFKFLAIVGMCLFSSLGLAAEPSKVVILCYHNLNPTVPGSMTLTPARFESEIKWLKDNGYHVIPLKAAAEYLQGKRASLPSKPIVVTVDDGWQSVYKYMLPIVQKYQIPVTLFIYPGTISEGKNAMTWNELKTLQDTGLFNIESHTFTHPNFKQAKKNMTPANYEKFVSRELVNSKKILEEKLGKPISYLAWPFGIYNEYLEKAAANAGYAMAFTIDYKPANPNFRAMAQPRYMIVEGQSTNSFQSIVSSAR